MSGDQDSTAAGSGWADAWPDALAFAVGLALAWFGGWQAKDLVWSLWLSSLLVGYAMIVWGIFGPVVFIGTKAWSDRAMLQGAPEGPALLGGAALLAGGLFLLAFFTVHFGMFHYVHSVFLNSFFPIGDAKNFPGPAIYFQVLHDYWPFVLVAAVAERQAFRLSPPSPQAPDISVKAADVNRRLANLAKAGPAGGGMMAPYRNVIRMHLLIFFFAFAHFAKMENFWIYAIVYAVYFFPWRLVKRGAA